VHDPAALAQQLMQMVELQRQVQAQLDMVARLDFTGRPTLRQHFNELYAWLDRSIAVGYSVLDVLQRFDTLYPETMDGDLAELAGRVRPWLEASRAALRQSMAVHSQVVTNQPRTAALTSQLLARSEAAVGQTQALQAGNQLLGVLIQQQAELQAALISGMRVEQLKDAARLGEDARSRALKERLWEGWGEATGSATPPRPFADR
jgi:P-type conjugative transfer protein TrbJ